MATKITKSAEGFSVLFYRKREQALLVLVHLTEGDTFQDLAISFGTGTTTAWRYVQEGVMLTARYAPTLKRATALAARLGFACLDGTLIELDHNAEQAARAA